MRLLAPITFNFLQTILAVLGVVGMMCGAMGHGFSDAELGIVMGGMMKVDKDVPAPGCRLELPGMSDIMITYNSSGPLIKAKLHNTRTPFATDRGGLAATDCPAKNTWIQMDYDSPGIDGNFKPLTQGSVEYDVQVTPSGQDSWWSWPVKGLRGSSDVCELDFKGFSNLDFFGPASAAQNFTIHGDIPSGTGTLVGSFKVITVTGTVCGSFFSAYPIIVAVRGYNGKDVLASCKHLNANACGSALECTVDTTDLGGGFSMDIGFANMDDKSDTDLNFVVVADLVSVSKTQDNTMNTMNW